MVAVSDLLQQLLIALGLGLLVGLQRERVATPLAGVRTFPLVTLLGTLTAQMAAQLGGWLVAAGLAGLAALVVTGNVLLARKGEFDPGQTTEVALLLMYSVGAYVVLGPRALAIAVGAGVAVLLHLKPDLHGIAGRIRDRDFRAMMTFVLLSLVILPVLPDRTYGPYDVLNPREIWWMVVLIVGIGLAGYLAYKRLGSAAGSLLAGLAGGLISSTATTAGSSRRAADRSMPLQAAAITIVVASAVVFARVLVEMAVVAPDFLLVAAGPVGILLLASTAVALAVWLRAPRREEELHPHGNPAELKSALVFAALYALVLLAIAAAEDRFGGRGLYVVAVLSGLTDMDAVTLSTSQLVRGARLDAALGWRLVLVASLANLVFKAAVVAVLGGRKLLRIVAIAFGAVGLVGALLLLFWP